VRATRAGGGGWALTRSGVVPALAYLTVARKFDVVERGKSWGQGVAARVLLVWAVVASLSSLAVCVAKAAGGMQD
jgi:hypothetical protein